MRIISRVPPRLAKCSKKHFHFSEFEKRSHLSKVKDDEAQKRARSWLDRKHCRPAQRSGFLRQRKWRWNGEMSKTQEQTLFLSQWFLWAWQSRSSLASLSVRKLRRKAVMKVYLSLALLPRQAYERGKFPKRHISGAFWSKRETAQQSWTPSIWS